MEDALELSPANLGSPALPGPSSCVSPSVGVRQDVHVGKRRRDYLLFSGTGALIESMSSASQTEPTGHQSLCLTWCPQVSVPVGPRATSWLCQR